ncbi:sigma factor AlgU regulatory protein MucB [Cellvibrio zantedeschiae]|uniref:Sigma factor AlgU regulatory protein MucB n=1 Tax=Cellvibrio zantedeschiae TaxID=1237077 RepID=A0ABQ3B2N9_9GAMM|nr:MucB/RseB C-terminal domain-containing protein [Cellvibrio zantedeschiae]GGY73709.1 sigma factor AlgU regulatory protein MucB [Cellvibrio zantedeschiae]
MPKMSLWLSSFVLAITTSVQAQTVATQNPSLNSLPTVQLLLSKMSQDAARINYRGSFTYQNQTSELQSFRVEHWIENGIEHDRFLFLNGPERVIVRDGQRVDCKAMGDELLQGSFASLGKTLIKMDQLYQFEIRGRERVAGRWSRGLQVIPKDPYRYGYLLNIDEETGLVLKSWLIDETARPLERYQFISIELDPDFNQFKSKSLLREHKAVADVTPCNPTEFTKPSAWNVGWAPPGFVFAGQRKLANGQSMLMYTDGLTTFSIFIEATTSFVPEGTGKRGATLAYMSRLVVKDVTYRVSVVGEIPVAAAAKIAQNITGL